MDSVRIVGFTESASQENGLLSAEAVATCKLHTQRSLLSELLATLACGNEEEGHDDSASDTDESSDDEDDLSAPPLRQSTGDGMEPTQPMAIPCCAERSASKQRDAIRRMLHQQQMQKQLLQQQQLQQQQLQQAAQQQGRVQQQGRRSVQQAY